jgi:hypothetical protein
MLNGTYLLATLVVAAFILWPEESIAVLTAWSLKIQIHFLNYRLKWMAWRMYRSIIKMSKESGFPHPGPFTFVNIWDRESSD